MTDAVTVALLYIIQVQYNQFTLPVCPVIPPQHVIDRNRVNTVHEISKSSSFAASSVQNQYKPREATIF